MATQTAHLVLVTCLAVATSASANSTGHAVWNLIAGVTVLRDEDLTLICSITGLSTLDVVRVYHRTNGHARTIADNGDVKRPFAALRRYSVHYTFDNGIGITRIGYRGIQGRDAGTLGCYRLGATEKEMAIVVVTVIVPVSDIYMAFVGTDGLFSRLPVDVNSSTMSSSWPTATVRQHRFSGIACVAVYDDICAAASLPRLLRITLESVDITSRFTMTTDSVRTTVSGAVTVKGNSSTTPIRQRAAGVSGFSTTRTGASNSTSSGVIWDAGSNVVADLDVCRSTVTLTHLTAEPDPLDHRKLLQCVANIQQVSLSSTASVVLDVQFVPLVSCNETSTTTVIGQPVVFLLQVRSNPTAQLSLSRFSNGNRLSTHANNLTDTIVLEEQAVDMVLTNVYMTVTPTQSSQFGVYSLTASNVVGSTSMNLELTEDKPVNATSDLEEEGNMTMTLERNQFNGSPITESHWFNVELVGNLVNNLENGSAAGLDGISNMHQAFPDSGATTRTSRKLLLFGAILSPVIVSKLTYVL